MDCLETENRERKEEVDSEELAESDRRASEISKRAWWRLERRSSMAWCFFCKSASRSRVLVGILVSGRSSSMLILRFFFPYYFFLIAGTAHQERRSDQKI